MTMRFTMKKTRERRASYNDDMLPEYNFDMSKAKPNRFAAKLNKDIVTVVLEPDVAQVFTTAEAVNRALRAIIQAMPENQPRKRARKVTA